MSDSNIPSNAEPSAKESQPLKATSNANVIQLNAEPPKANSNAVTANGNTSPDEELSDEDYEVEYVYEDEEEVDATDLQVPPLEEDEEDVEVEYEDEEDIEEDDDAEFDRIASKIDELLDKTTSLKMESSPGDTVPVSEGDETSNEGVQTADNAATTPVPSAQQPVRAAVSAANKLTDQQEEEMAEDEEYEVEYVDEEEEEKMEERDVEKEKFKTPVPEEAPVEKKPNLPVERSSTVEDGTSFSPTPLRHAQNQWNISDISELKDEGTLQEASKDSPYSDTEAEQQTSLVVPNLDAIKEEAGDSPENSKQTSILQETGRPVDRFAHKTLKEAMEDEVEDEEINEIEIALEEWSEGDQENVDDDEYEEEDENDEVDPAMPDNLLLHSNDQIEQIDLPLTPSPTPNTTILRPFSPSSSILSKVRHLVINGQLEALEDLLNATPNFFIDSILKAGWTALMYASYRANPEMVHFCLKRGADVNYSKDFFTSLMAVCSSSNGDESQVLHCLGLLLEQAARVNALDKFSCSPLHYAARFGRPAAVILLLQHGAHINQSNRNGWTALHWAAAENHGEVVEALLDHGADVLLETRDGVTAGELAAIRKNRQIAELLHDIEESELKVLAEGSTESSIAKSSQAEQLASVPVKVSEPELKQEPEPVPVPEPVFEPQSRNESTVPQPLPELDSEPEFIETPVIARPFPAYERKFSQEEIEARKDEAREIVISAIDAALARNLGKLMGSAQLPEHDSSNTESELRSRRVPRDVADQLEGKSEEGDSDLTETMQAGEVGANAHNMVMSLAIAAALFFFFKLMWYFNSSS